MMKETNLNVMCLCCTNGGMDVYLQLLLFFPLLFHYAVTQAEQLPLHKHDQNTMKLKDEQ